MTINDPMGNFWAINTCEIVSFCSLVKWSEIMAFVTKERYGVDELPIFLIVLNGDFFHYLLEGFPVNGIHEAFAIGLY